MKFERSELGALFSKLRTAVPEVRAVGTDDAGILLSGSNAYATNLELSVRAGLSKPVEQDVVVPPRGVDFISGTVAPEISIEADIGKARMCWKSVRWMDTGWRLPESIAQLMVIFALRFLRPRQRQLIRFLWMVAWKLCVTGKRLFSVTAISR